MTISNVRQRSMSNVTGQTVKVRRESWDGGKTFGPWINGSKYGPVSMKVSSMNDYLSTPETYVKKNNRRPWLNCTHTKDVVLSKGAQAPGTYRVSSGGRITEYAINGDCLALAANLNGPYVVGTVPSLSACKSDVLNQLSGAVPESYHVNLGELVETLVSPRAILSNLRGIYENAKNLTNRYNSGKLRSALDLGADSYLFYNLVVAPFISELKNIGNLSQNIEAHVRSLETKSRAPAFILSSSLSDGGRIDATISYDRWYEWRNRVGYTALVSAQYDVGGASEAKAYLLSTLNVFEVFRPISTAYNLLPFTFILDYFVNLGETLKLVEDQFFGITRLDDLVLPGTVNVHRACSTLRTEVTHNEPVLWSSGQRFSGPVIKSSSFTRTVYPDIEVEWPESFINGSGLTWKRGGIVGSLGYAVATRSMSKKL